MMDIRKIHEEAMDLAERAMIDRARGKSESAKKLLTEALLKEERAARLAVQNDVPEPTRTILLKSAAHLAVDVGDVRLAEELIGLAIAGDPPEELSQELRGLFTKMHVKRSPKLLVTKTAKKSSKKSAKKAAKKSGRLLRPA